MKFGFRILLTLILTFFVVTTACHAAPRAVAGTLDLTQWDLREYGIVRLDGEWEFYGGVFIPAGSFDAPDLPMQPQFIPVPGSWEGYLDQSGAPMGSDGFATYRLRILLPGADTARTGPPGASPEELSIFIPYLHTSYQLWVDGKLLAANGVIGRTRSEAKPQFRPEVVRFTPSGPYIDVVLHVSNFHFREGGLPRRVEFGTAEQVTLRQRRIEVAGAALFGANVIMALFFFAVFVTGTYAQRKDSRADLYFSLFLLSLALRMLFTGDHLLARVVREIPWELSLKIEYLMGYLSPLCFLYYLRALFPEDVARFVLWAGTAVAAAGSAATLLLPGRISSEIIPAYLVVLAVLLLYFVYVGFRAVALHRPDASLLGGVGVTIAASLITLLRYTGIAVVPDLTPLGIGILVLSQCLVLAVRLARAYRSAMTLAEENARMLVKTEWQLQKLKEYRRLMTQREENLRRRIAETLHGQTQGRLFAAVRRIDHAQRVMNEDIAAANEYLNDAKELITRVREEDIRTTGWQLHPAAVGAGIVAAIESLLDTFEESYQVHFEVDPRVEAMDHGDSGGFPYDLRLGAYRTVEEGLNNISRHAQAQSIRLSLTLATRGGEDFLEITLADDGVGFDPNSPTAGLGLQTIDARVGDLGGHWKLTSSPGNGTTLYISIPIAPAGSTYGAEAG